MLLEGEYVGRYHLLRVLGSGGMGEVYLAEDRPIQRQVAIKVIRTEIVSYPGAQVLQETERLFQREARAIATLDHPHILPLYDYGETSLHGTTMAYLVMPYRPEGSLASWLQSQGYATTGGGKALSPQDIISLIRQAAEALQHAHDHQIVHQDVKPANFLLRPNSEHPQRPDLLLADFGIARLMASSAGVSRNVRGTPTHMAPEQLEGLAVPATDQYALAMMAYELLTGTTPFRGALGQIIYQQLHEQPQAPSMYNPSISADVDTVILRALKKKPEERFSSIKAFARAFQIAMEGQETPTTLNSRVEPTTDLQANLVISDGEARSGTRRNLSLQDGRQVSVAVPAGAYTGQRLYFAGLGLPSNTDKSGALYITLTVTAPPQAFLGQGIEPTVLASSPQLSPPLAFRGTAHEHSWRPVLLLAFLVIIIAVGSVIFGVSTLLRRNQPASASTSTAGISHATPVGGDPYTHRGKLVLNDPLQDNSQHMHWMLGTNQNQASCSFVGDAYQSSQPVDGDFHVCLALNSNFSNLVYEVQMKIIAGYAGGVIFRDNQANSTFYLLRVGQNGTYDLRSYVDAFIEHSHLLISGFSSALHEGPDQSNLLAVVADGNLLQLYANHQLLGSVNDSAFSQGQIGVIAFNQGGLAIANYSQARVWSLA